MLTKYTIILVGARMPTDGSSSMVTASLMRPLVDNSSSTTL
jgi:hypothetical protein